MSSPSKHDTIVGTGDGGWFLGSFSNEETLIFACWLINGASSEIAVATNATPIFDGQWHHVTGIFDGSSIHLYVDGSHGERPSVGGEISFSSEPGVQTVFTVRFPAVTTHNPKSDNA